MLGVRLVALLALLAAPAHASGAGLAVAGQAAKAAALAEAWVAGADSPAAAWYNPAALVWLREDGVEVGGSLRSATSGTRLQFQPDPAAGPSPLAAATRRAAAGHLYVAYRLGPRLAAGVGVNTPYSLRSEWRQRPVTFAAASSALETVAVYPSLALRLGRGWSVAVGLAYLSADLSLTRQVPVELDGVRENGPEVVARSRLELDGDAVGFRIAARGVIGKGVLGADLRSGLTPGLRGSIDYFDTGPVDPFLRDGPAAARLALPPTLTAGYRLEPLGAWDVELDAVWSGWSRTGTLAVDLATEVPGFSEDAPVLGSWRDTLSLRLGAQRTGRGLEWRLGARFDPTPIRDAALGPALPEGDRLGLAFGVGKAFGRWTLDLFTLHSRMGRRRARPGAGTGNPGIVAGTYTGSEWQAGVTVGRGF